MFRRIQSADSADLHWLMKLGDSRGVTALRIPRLPLLSSPGFGGTVGAEEQEAMNGPRNPMNESDVERVDAWVLNHIDEEKF